MTVKRGHKWQNDGATGRQGDIVNDMVAMTQGQGDRLTGARVTC